MEIKFRWFLRKIARSFIEDIECMDCMLRPLESNHYKYKVRITDSKSLYLIKILSSGHAVGQHCFDAQKELEVASSTLCLKKYWEF